MEHRWGRRTSLWTAVRLRADNGAGAGRIRDASASGAFVETELRFEAGSRIEIGFRDAWIAAFVTRADPDGLGLEWWEFAPPEVVETLDRIDELRQLRADFGRNLPRGDAALRRS